MIFQKSDQKFVLQAKDADRRAVLIGRLRLQRIVSCIGFGISILSGFLQRGTTGLEVMWILATLFYASFVHEDMQIKVLGLFDRESSINPAQPTDGRSAASGG